MNSPLVLSIHYGHNATVGLAAGDEIVCLVSEERFSRLKNATGFPRQALDYVRREYLQGDLQALDRVVVNDRTFAGYTYLQRFGLEPHSYTDYYWKNRKHRQSTSPLRVTVRGMTRRLRPATFSLPGDATPQIAALIGVPSSKLTVLDHHEAHTLSCAYQLTKDMPWLIFTLDAEGDGRCATVNLWQDGRLVCLHSTSPHASLGYLYRAVTGYLGMKPDEHEFKVMGLAPYADPGHARRIADIFRQFLWLNDAGGFISSESLLSCDDTLSQQLSYERFDHVAGGVQLFTEQIMSDWITHWINKTGVAAVAGSGGVFMNVKATHTIAQLPAVKQLYVLPSAGDESLVLGGCYHGLAACGVREIKPLRHLYLGRSFTRAEILAVLTAPEVIREFTYVELDADTLSRRAAALLADREIVARCVDREEWGARALGNRSILAHPADAAIVHTLNASIKSRDFWMPFAPSIRQEDFDEYVCNPKALNLPFMNAAFDSTPRARRELRAALHPQDHTLRPHRVDRDINSGYHTLLTEFQRLTGIGGLLNTSFNLHGEPNVSAPADALHTLRHSGLRHLILGNCLVHKRNETR